jgi:hypothetical protein
MRTITFINAFLSTSSLISLSVNYEINLQKGIINKKTQTSINSIIRIIISKNVLINWNYKDLIHDELLIKLLFPFVKEFIIKKVQNENLKNYEEINITKKTAPFKYPYNLKNINKIKGLEIIVNPDE